MILFRNRPFQRPVLWRTAAVCLLALCLCACMGRGREQVEVKTAARAGETSLAYGVSLVLPAGWKTATLEPSAANRQSLDGRWKAGERISLLEAQGVADQRGAYPLLVAFLVNQEGNFMPRAIADKISADELDRMSRDVLAREKADAKKKKVRSGLLDVQLVRDDVAGHLAISQRMLVAGPDGKPVRLINWDIYLPGGAGLAVKTVCFTDGPGEESAIINAVKSLRFAQ